MLIIRGREKQHLTPQIISTKSFANLLAHIEKRKTTRHIRQDSMNENQQKQTMEMSQILP
jgi:hypothetical protein